MWLHIGALKCAYWPSVAVLIEVVVFSPNSLKNRKFRPFSKEGLRMTKQLQEQFQLNQSVLSGKCCIRFHTFATTRITAV